VLARLHRIHATESGAAGDKANHSDYDKPLVEKSMLNNFKVYSAFLQP
jgi:hypothetical protein